MVREAHIIETIREIAADFSPKASVLLFSRQCLSRSPFSRRLCHLQLLKNVIKTFLVMKPRFHTKDSSDYVPCLLSKNICGKGMLRFVTSP